MTRIPMNLVRPAYPPELESAWLSCAQAAHPDLSRGALLQRLAPQAAMISDVLTIERGVRGADYTADADARFAYGLFFFPQTWQRAAFTFHEVLSTPAGLLREQAGATLHIVDIGCGAGAATLALLDAYAALRQPPQFSKLCVEIHALDREPALLNIFQRLLDTLRTRWPFAIRFHPYPGAAMENFIRATDQIPGGVDAVISGFALNEFFEGTSAENWRTWAETAFSRLRPSGGLFMMEPAMPEVADALRGIRELFAGREDAHLSWPCSHRCACPMPPARHRDVLCHEVRAWTAPASAREMNRWLQRDLATVKWCGLALLRSPAADPSPSAGAPEFWGRMISPMMEANGRMITRVCACDGALHGCEWLTRRMPREERRAVARWERGDMLEISAPRTLGDPPVWRAERWRRIRSFSGDPAKPALPPT